eukprot:g33922.t1
MALSIPVQCQHLHIMATIEVTNCRFKVEMISKKIVHIDPDIKFLQKCKKAGKTPKGLQIMNPFKSSKRCNLETKIESIFSAYAQDTAEQLQDTANHNTLIKPADKGGAIVIQNRMDYCKEVYRQLNNQEHYRQLPAKPTKEHTCQLNRGIETFDPVLQNILCTLIPCTSHVGDYYCLPKIHKANTPGRPIIPVNGTLRENLSGYVESILKCIVQRTPGFCCDTTDFLQKLAPTDQSNQEYSSSQWMFQLSTPTSPHNNGIAATASVLNTTNCQFPDAIVQLICFIPDYNVSNFDNQFFIQTHGTAMGTK